MNNLLLFFALPIATIILASVLQTVLKNPVLVALTFFAIYLIVTFAIFDETFLIFAIVYTILAYISAVITQFLMNLSHCRERVENIIENNCNNSNDENTILNTVKLVPTNDTITTNMQSFPKYRYRNFRR